MSAEQQPGAAPAGPADGGYGEVMGAGGVRFERTLPAPVGRVWSYLAETDHRGEWLASGEMELEPGSTVELFFHHAELSGHHELPPPTYADMRDGVSLPCTVLACEAPYLLKLEWGSGATASEVSFELHAADGKTRLVLTHRRLRDRAALVETCAGWQAHLAILADRLAHQPPHAFWKTHNEAAAVYEQRIPR
jgi:uncharacterized protein YndB with AHSA1/START domain